MNGYIGPAPVSLHAYSEMVAAPKRGARADSARGGDFGYVGTGSARGHGADSWAGRQFAPQPVS